MKPQVETEFGQMLRKYRSRNHISQTVLAQKIGVSTNTVHLWETGRSRPEMGSLQKLAELMDMPLLQVLELSGH